MLRSRRGLQRLVALAVAVAAMLGMMQAPAQAQTNVIGLASLNVGFTLRGTNGPGVPGFRCTGTMSPREQVIWVSRGYANFGERWVSCTSSRTGSQLRAQLFGMIHFRSNGVADINWYTQLFQDGRKCGEGVIGSLISGRDRSNLTSSFNSQIAIPTQGGTAGGCSTAEGFSFFSVTFTEGLRV